MHEGIAFIAILAVLLDGCVRGKDTAQVRGTLKQEDN